MENCQIESWSLLSVVVVKVTAAPVSNAVGAGSAFGCATSGLAAGPAWAGAGTAPATKSGRHRQHRADSPQHRSHALSFPDD
jgi:hypothetical protein